MIVNPLEAGIWAPRWAGSPDEVPGEKEVGDSGFLPQPQPREASVRPSSREQKETPFLGGSGARQALACCVASGNRLSLSEPPWQAITCCV